MDFNNHTDLLVGAYESDTVVILRSRPVIDIITWFGNKTVRINPSKLGCDMDPTSEEVCFQVNVPPTHLIVLTHFIQGGVLFPNPELPGQH